MTNIALLRKSDNPGRGELANPIDVRIGPAVRAAPRRIGRTPQLPCSLVKQRLKCSYDS